MVLEHSEHSSISIQSWFLLSQVGQARKECYHDQNGIIVRTG